MSWVAIKMLTGNRGKYIGIILGVAFAALLIAQQASIFCGLMLLTTSQIKDIEGADIWVMDPQRPVHRRHQADFRERPVSRPRRARRATGPCGSTRDSPGPELANGKFQQMILIGLDDATLVGARRRSSLGNLATCAARTRSSSTKTAIDQLWPDEPFELGRTFEMNDRLATIVGVFKARRTFQTFPVVYTRYSQATLFVPRQRKVLSLHPGPAAARIASGGSLPADQAGKPGWKAANPRSNSPDRRSKFYMQKTGIPINFGITVLLGFIVGMAIAGQTFYLVHGGKPEAVRHAQGHGGQQRHADLDDPAAGGRGGLYRLWPGRGAAVASAMVRHAIELTSHACQIMASSRCRERCLCRAYLGARR